MAGATGIADTAARLVRLAGGSAAARTAAGALPGAAQAGDGSAAPRAGGCGRFDRTIDALNRLPRPAFALGALALFGFGVVDPAGFAERMAAFASVPEPLWWLLGGVVGFYFGARELHHFREGRVTAEAPGPLPAPLPLPPTPAAVLQDPAPEEEAKDAARTERGSRSAQGKARTSAPRARAGAGARIREARP